MSGPLSSLLLEPIIKRVHVVRPSEVHREKGNIGSSIGNSTRKSMTA